MRPSILAYRSSPSQHTESSALPRTNLLEFQELTYSKQPLEPISLHGSEKYLYGDAVKLSQGLVSSVTDSNVSGCNVGFTI
jgi:hypothetical protein